MSAPLIARHVSGHPHEGPPDACSQGRLVTAGMAVVAACAGLVATAPSAPASAPPRSTCQIVARTRQHVVAVRPSATATRAWCGGPGRRRPDRCLRQQTRPSTASFRVRVTFPEKDLEALPETLVRFSVGSGPTTPASNTTNDLALYLYPDRTASWSPPPDGSAEPRGHQRHLARARHLACWSARSPSLFRHPAPAPSTARVGDGVSVKPTRSPPPGCQAPTYHQFSAPAASRTTRVSRASAATGSQVGERSSSNTDRYVVTFDDHARTSTWKNVNTDPPIRRTRSRSTRLAGPTTTGRTIVSQLYLACSATAYSDDDFSTPTQSRRRAAARASTASGTTRPSAAARHPRARRQLPARRLLLQPGCGAGAREGLLLAQRRRGVTLARPWRCGTPSARASTGVQVNLDGGVFTCRTPSAATVRGRRGVPGRPDLEGPHDPGSIAWPASDPGRDRPDNTPTSRPPMGPVRRGRDLLRPAGAGCATSTSAASPASATPSSRWSWPATATRTLGRLPRHQDAWLDPGGVSGKSADGSTFTGAAWHLYVATTYDRGAHVEDGRRDW